MRKDSYYESEENKNWLKVLFLLLFLIIIVLLVFYIIQTSKGSKVENNLLTAGKDYYKSGDVLMPEAAGECSIVTLDTLLASDYIKNESLFKSCDMDSTYVKVCRLQSGKYHYTPIISCNSKDDTTFGDWKTGNESDLVEDKSNIRFSYLAQVYSSQAKKYYPNDETSESKVSALYITAPTKEHIYKDNGISASKWYTEYIGNNYWNNGAYSSTQPAGYANKGAEGSSITSVSLTKPLEANYRTITPITLYRTLSVKKPYVYSYVCIDKIYGGSIVSDIPCESRTSDNYNTMLIDNYTCDGKTTVSKNAVCSTTPSSDWTASVCKESATVKCETTQGYQYVDKRWQWYSTGTYRKYYPSGASVSSKESTYYTSAPVAGAKQDTATTTTAYKYYKLVEDNTASNGKWLNLNDEYVDEDGLIEIFKKGGYSVNSLEEVQENEKLKYSIKLEYSNRK